MASDLLNVVCPEVLTQVGDVGEWHGGKAIALGPLFEACLHLSMVVFLRGKDLVESFLEGKTLLSKEPSAMTARSCGSKS